MLSEGSPAGIAMTKRRQPSITRICVYYRNRISPWLVVQNAGYARGYRGVSRRGRMADPVTAPAGRSASPYFMHRRVWADVRYCRR